MNDKSLAIEQKLVEYKITKNKKTKIAKQKSIFINSFDIKG